MPVLLWPLHPPAKTTWKPADSSTSRTWSRLSPWISIAPFFNVPPTPQRFWMVFFKAFFSSTEIPTKFLATVIHPPLPAERCRRTSTRPRLLRCSFGRTGLAGVLDTEFRFGSPVTSRLPKGLLLRSVPPLLESIFFRFLPIALKGTVYFPQTPLGIPSFPSKCMSAFS